MSDDPDAHSPAITKTAVTTNASPIQRSQVELIVRSGERVTISDLPQDGPPLGPEEDDRLRRVVGYTCLALLAGTVIYAFVAVSLGGDLWDRTQILVLAIIPALALILGPLTTHYFFRK